MPTDTRDIRAINSVECPRCHAWAKHPCFHKGQPTPVKGGKPFCHAERRRANQERLRALGGVVFLLFFLLLLCPALAVAQCPLSNLVVKVMPTQTREGVRVEPEIHFTNSSGKTIIGIMFSTAWADVVADLHSDVFLTAFSGKIRAGESKKVNFAELPPLEQRSWYAAPFKILFEDNSKWALSAEDKQCFARTQLKRRSGPVTVVELPVQLLR